MEQSANHKLRKKRRAFALEKGENSTTYCDIKLKMVDKKVVETRYAHDS